MSRTDSTFIIVATALWIGGAGLYWGTHTAGGADSYGYVSQAALWTDGDLIVQQPLAESLPWPEVDATLSPLGYRPGVAPGTIVPVYPSGLPIVMALFQVIAGREAVFWVVPMLGMLAVVAAAALAYKLAGPIAGAFCALFLAASPTLVYSATWPMSDAAATGWWALAVLSVTGLGMRSAGVAGGAAALAIMTRPNLVVVALVPFAYLAVCAVREWRRESLNRLLLFSGLVAVGCLAVAALQALLYGSPVESGYGDLGNFFEMSPRSYNPTGVPMRPLINASRFAGLLWTVEPALIACAAVGSVAVFVPPATRESRAIGWMCVGVVLTVFASYLFFRSFDEWWLLRLLLPGFPALAVLAGTGVARVAERLWSPLRIALLAYLVAVIGWFGVTRAFAWEVHESRVNEARYERVASFIAEELPSNAVIFAFQHSGSVRYYADRMTVRFDVLHGEWLESATTTLRDRGLAPFYLVEEPETSLFRERFIGSTELGRLDWPPLAEFSGPVIVRIYDPGDRLGPMAGSPRVTRHIAVSQ